MFVEGCAEAASGQLRSGLYRQKYLQADASGGKVPVKFKGPNMEKVVYVLYLTLIGLAAETLRIKQTDLNTGLSGLS